MNLEFMEYCEKNLNNFTVIYSETLNNQNITTFSSSSSTSSNSSFIDTKVQASITTDNNVPQPSTESLVSESILKQPQSPDDRKKELSKKKEEKLILKYQQEEAAKLQVIARSKCGKYVKYDCKIGEGGYKIVSKGFDKEMCRAIAWCEVKREHVDSKEKNQSMFKEIEIMLKLDHPNVVKCYAVLKDWWLIRDEAHDKRCEAKGLVIIQELMGAGTLKEMIKKNFQDGRCILDIRLITLWLYQILDVLRYMHCRIQPPIIHRDVKSENCFLVEQTGDEFVSVKIGDFGLATTINHNSRRKTMIGTVGFMAPEVYEESYDNKVDIYAFGMMVLEVMTNKTPYDDCTNVFQVVSKSMGSHLPDVISTITQPLIKEIILACVHPVPTYRPSAEELCEHAIFQNCPLIVEPVMLGCMRSEALSKFVNRLTSNYKFPIIDLVIRINDDFVLPDTCTIDTGTVTFSLDVYQAHNCDLCEFLTVLNSHIENEFKASYKNLNRFKKLNDSVRLQIQYLIKLVNGERWRRIFEDFLNVETENKRNHRSNSTPNQRNILPEIDGHNPSNSLNFGFVDKYTNNFTEYTNNVTIYHRAKDLFEEEIENYCLEAKKQQKPYFFKFSSKNKTVFDSSDGLIAKELNSLTLNIDKNGVKKQTHFPSRFVHSKNGSGIQVSPITDTVSINDDVFLSPPGNDQRELIKSFVRAELYSSADSYTEEEVTSPGYDDQKEPHYVKQESNNSGYNVSMVSLSGDTWVDQYTGRVVDRQYCVTPQHQHENMKTNLFLNQNGCDPNQISGCDYMNYRQVYEPDETFPINSYLQMNHIYPIRNNLQSGSNTIYPESYISHITFNEDPSGNPGYIQQSHIWPPDHIYIQPQSKPPINYTKPTVFCTQSKFISASQNLLLSHNVHGGYCYSQAPFIYPNPQLMQTNTPYMVSQDQMVRNPISMSQPVLTRSLPSIVGSVPTSFDNVIVSGIYQSYVSSTSNAIISQSGVPISGSGINGNGNMSLRPVIIPNCSQNQLQSQRFNIPVISTAKAVPVRPQSSYSSVYSSSKVVEKPKKKSKSRLKSKYLLKVIHIQENSNPGESILTFEMMLPMHQMRFTCCLSNEFNSLDVSNSVGESGQIPGELGKKDILESLVMTVKKICQCLRDDIHSISLNEDYVFHPCAPNSGLIKLSDCFSIPLSLDVDLSQVTASLQSTLSLQPFTTFNNSCTSSRSLSRHPSAEDLCQSMGTSMTEQISSNVTENDLIVFSENDLIKPGAPAMLVKSVSETDPCIHTIVPTKCTCPMSDSAIKVPEYLFSTLKQTVDKLLSLHCKGLIILPNSNDILTRNFRVLEIPADHMFVGLPCSDHSYNVIKGQKDKDFIIAKDNRDPDNVADKCVYQKPADGAVILDSAGEIQYIQKPSLIIPSKPGFGSEKSVVKELPSELTHHGDQVLDFDQIVSVLQSLTQNQGCANQSKDELFDSPVLLEPAKILFQKSQTSSTDKPDTVDGFGRRGSDDVVIAITQPQSQIQVERIFCQYVTLPKPSDSRHEDSAFLPEPIERDLPRQQVRSRKISNESLDSISAIRTRPNPTVPFVNETDLLQQQSSFPKPLGCSQMNLQNSPKSHPMGTIINQMPLQRLSAVIPGSTSGQFILANQNPNSSMPGNIFIQNVQNVPVYSNPSQGSGSGINFSHVLPNQVVIPAGMTANQMSQLHQIQQQQQSQGQRIAVPSSLSSTTLSSSQLMTNLQAIQQNIIPVSQPLHHPQMPLQFTEQFSHQSSHTSDLGDPATMAGLSRQIPLSNIRQMPGSSVGSSPYFDQNVINSIMADNLRIQMMNQSTSSNTAQSQSQVTPVMFIPHQSMATTNNPTVTGGIAPTLSKQTLSTDLANQNATVQKADIDSKPKAEQTIGRFVVRPVTDGSEN